NETPRRVVSSLTRERGVLVVEGVGFPRGPRGEKLWILPLDLAQRVVEQAAIFDPRRLHAFEGLRDSPRRDHRFVETLADFVSVAIGSLLRAAGSFALRERRRVPGLKGNQRRQHHHDRPVDGDEQPLLQRTREIELPDPVHDYAYAPRTAFARALSF